jgi:hypothetical protein
MVRNGTKWGTTDQGSENGETQRWWIEGKHFLLFDIIIRYRFKLAYNDIFNMCKILYKTDLF